MMQETTFLNHVKANEQKLFRYALRMLKDVAKAEDAVQDLVLKLWKRRDQLQIQNLDAFFMVAMKNHCYDELKKTKRRRTHYEKHTSLNNNNTNRLERQTEKQDVLNYVQQLIELLPETQQMIIQLRDVEQLEMKEIEEITGLSNGAIRANLSRARKTLREEIIKLNGYGLD